MLRQAVVGVDVGTPSTKAVLIDRDGTVLRSALRQHSVVRPGPVRFEMDPHTWWQEFTSLIRELTADRVAEVVAVGVSGMGPCVVLADEQNNRCVRPSCTAWTRSTAQIARLDGVLGGEEIARRCGSALSTQAAILHGVTRDQFMTRHRANHLNGAYAPDPASADKALLSKAAVSAELGVHVHLCGDVAL